MFPLRDIPSSPHHPAAPAVPISGVFRWTGGWGKEPTTLSYLSALEDVAACSFAVTKHLSNSVISILLNYIAFSTELFKLHSSLLVNTKTNERSMACKNDFTSVCWWYAHGQQTNKDTQCECVAIRTGLHVKTGSVCSVRGKSLPDTSVQNRAGRHKDSDSRLSYGGLLANVSAKPTLLLLNHRFIIDPVFLTQRWRPFNAMRVDWKRFLPPALVSHARRCDDITDFTKYW